MNKTAINICIWIFLWTYLIVWDRHTANSYYEWIFNFTVCQLSFKADIPFFIPISNVWKFHYSSSSHCLQLSICIYFSHFNICVVVAYWALNWIFLIILRYVASFEVFSYHLCFISGEVIIQILSWFLWIGSLLSLSWKSSLHIWKMDL